MSRKDQAAWSDMRRCVVCSAHYEASARFCDQCGRRTTKEQRTSGATSELSSNQVSQIGKNTNTQPVGIFWSKDPSKCTSNMPSRTKESSNDESSHAIREDARLPPLIKGTSQKSFKQKRKRSLRKDTSSSSIDQPNQEPNEVAPNLPSPSESTTNTPHQVQSSNLFAESAASINNSEAMMGSGSLWGQCLMDAVASFEATEVILSAEIEADERCISFLKQTFQSRAAYVSTEVRHKQSTLEKKLVINREKLVQVRTRLRQLKAQIPPTETHLNPLVSISATLEASESKLQACVRIQRAYRIHRGRQGLLKLVWSVYKKVYDPDTKTYYYYNSRTGVSKWETPYGLDSKSLKRKARRRKSVRQQEEGAMSLQQAAVNIQQLYRARLARKNMKLLVAGLYERVYDQETNSYYYYCKKSKTSQWEKPKWLEDDDKTPPTSNAKRDPAIHDEEMEKAAAKIQRLYRSRAARQFVKDLASGMIQKCYDSEYGVWYYYNARTQKSSWDKPKLLQAACRV